MIKAARLKKGYTQEHIARLLNITLKSYQNIETYKQLPKITTGLKLSALLDTDPFKLWDIEI